VRQNKKKNTVGRDNLFQKEGNLPVQRRKKKAYLASGKGLLKERRETGRRKRGKTCFEKKNPEAPWWGKNTGVINGSHGKGNRASFLSGKSRAAQDGKGF